MIVRSTWYPPHGELYSTEADRLLDGALTAPTRLRLRRRVQAWRSGLPRKALVRCGTCWARVWVVQVDGNGSANTVMLAGDTPGTRTTIELPFPHSGYDFRTPLGQWPAPGRSGRRGSRPDPAHAVANALTAVVTLMERHRRQRHPGVPLAQLDQAIAEPLRPFLAAWLYGDEHTEDDDRDWRLPALAIRRALTVAPSSTSREQARPVGARRVRVTRADAAATSWTNRPSMPRRCPHLGRTGRRRASSPDNDPVSDAQTGGQHVRRHCGAPAAHGGGYRGARPGLVA